MGSASSSPVVAAVVLLACVGPAGPPPPEHRVELCSAPEERTPLPSAACFWAPEGRRYAGRVGSAIGAVLTGWRSHAGEVELSVTFADDSNVASICYDRVAGDEVARRVPDLADRVRALPAAPACFADRRLDFSWESDVVTSDHVRQAVRECRRTIRPLRGQIDWCRYAQHCDVTQMRELELAADRELRSCVLQEVPLTMRTGVSRKILIFEPSAGRKPDPELAIQAQHVCDGLPREEHVVECMGRHGWQPKR